MKNFDSIYNHTLHNQLVKEIHEEMPPVLCPHAAAGCSCDGCDDCRSNAIKPKVEEQEEKNDNVKVCPYCHGSTQYRGDVCHFCSGSGEHPGDVCTSCDGSGKVGHGVTCHRCGGNGKIY